MDHQDVRPTGDAGDRRNIPDEIEIQLVIQRRVDCVRRTADEQRIAIWWRTHDRLSAQIAASTAPILDDKWLAKSIRQPLTDQAREDVESAAGAEADHDPHRPRRIGLRPCGTRHRRQRGSARGEMQECAPGKFHAFTYTKEVWIIMSA